MGTRLKNNQELKTTSTLQLGRNYSNEHDLNKKLMKFYSEGFNATDIEILETISWSYFPRWIEQGRHWQVFEMQGKERMWYAGSSVSFESVNSVLDYNNLLLKQMDTEMTP